MIESTTNQLKINPGLYWADTYYLAFNSVRGKNLRWLLLSMVVFIGLCPVLDSSPDWTWKIGMVLTLFLFGVFLYHFYKLAFVYSKDKKQLEEALIQAKLLVSMPLAKFLVVTHSTKYRSLLNILFRLVPILFVLSFLYIFWMPLWRPRPSSIENISVTLVYTFAFSSVVFFSYGILVSTIIKAKVSPETYEYLKMESPQEIEMEKKEKSQPSFLTIISFVVVFLIIIAIWLDKLGLKF